MAELKESPSQTAGPYVHIGCMPKVAGLKGMYGDKDSGEAMITGPVSAQKIALTFKVLDGSGEPLKDAMLEIWQAGPEGAFGETENFANWGRQPTDYDTGLVRFETVKPGAIGDQAPHILVWIVARGINLGLTTRLYFEDEAEQNKTDPVFQLAGARAATLVAKKTSDGYHHDIHLQGDLETVFFDV